MPTSTFINRYVKAARDDNRYYKSIPSQEILLSPYSKDNALNVQNLLKLFNLTSNINMFGDYNYLTDQMIPSEYENFRDMYAKFFPHREYEYDYSGIYNPSIFKITDTNNNGIFDIGPGIAVVANIIVEFDTTTTIDPTENTSWFTLAPHSETYVGSEGTLKTVLSLFARHKYDDSVTDSEIEMGLVTVEKYTSTDDIKYNSLALARIDFHINSSGDITGLDILERTYDNYIGEDFKIPRMTYNTAPFYKNYLLDGGFPQSLGTF